MLAPFIQTLNLLAHLLEHVYGHEDVSKSLGKWRLGRL
jgi:hypothetical protein